MVDEKEKTEQGETKESSETQKPDIVLEARIRGTDGMLSWNIPQNLMVASYLLTHLNMAIVEAHRSAVVKSREDVEKSTIFSKKIFSNIFGRKHK